MNLDYASTADKAGFEQDHWWTRSRFKLLDRVMSRTTAPASLQVLDVGCGTGLNLHYLEKHYKGRISVLVGVDPQAQPHEGAAYSIVRDLPSGTVFDVILAMDVLEHVEDPVALLRRLRTLLKPAGLLLITVPAFPWLWTCYDDLAHHYKRYRRGELLSELSSAQFQTIEHFYLFGSLFPLFVTQRLVLKWFPSRDAHVFKPTPAWLNSLCFGITACEMATWMPRNRAFGSSLVAIASPTPR